MSERVLVTGATGFIGREAIAELARRGHDVVALVRGRNPARRVAELGVRVRAHGGDLADRRSLELALAGTNAVVHLAALVDPALQTDDAEVRRMNRDLAVELGVEAREAGVRRFVFASSIAAMGFFSEPATSTSPCRPETAYGRAKLDAERALLALSTPSFRVVVLRLPTVYGPGERYNFLAWTRSVDRGHFRIIGRGHNVMPLCTTRNAARAIRAGVEGSLETGVYLVADSEPYPLTRIHRAILAAVGRREPLLHLPRPVAAALGAANEVVAARFSRVPLVLTRARVRTLTADQRFDVRPLLDRGVDLDAPLEEWVRTTVGDYRARGLVGSRAR